MVPSCVPRDMDLPATNAIVYRADALTEGLSDRDLARPNDLRPVAIPASTPEHSAQSNGIG